MLKWLHRGIVAVLLVVAVTSVIPYAQPPGSVIWKSLEWMDNEVHVISGQNILFAVVQCPDEMLLKSEASLFEFRFLGAGISLKREYEFGCIFDEAGERLRRQTEVGRITWILGAVAPLWLIAVMTSAYPAIFIWRYYRHRRQDAPTGCPHCHYDLTGNESGICPECGEAVEVAT